MNQEHMHPQNITQDVLLLTGENDEFIPSRVLEKQKQNLTSARSVTARLFTKEENADRHCQIGNVGVAVRTMTKNLSELEK